MRREPNGVKKKFHVARNKYPAAAEATGTKTEKPYILYSILYHFALTFMVVRFLIGRHMASLATRINP